MRDNADVGVASIVGAAAAVDGLAPPREDKPKTLGEIEHERLRAKLAAYPPEIKAKLEAIVKKHGTNRKARRATAKIVKVADRATVKKGWRLGRTVHDEAHVVLPATIDEISTTVVIGGDMMDGVVDVTAICDSEEESSGMRASQR